MKVLSKTLWAVDVDNVHSLSVERMKRVMNQFGNDMVVLHVLPKELKKSDFRAKVEDSIRTELEKIKISVDEHKQSSISIRIEYGNVSDKVLHVAKEEDVNAILINRGTKTTLGRNGVQIMRKSKKPVSILGEAKLKTKSHIVCPIDRSKESATALRSAILHARKTDSWLSVIGVYEPFKNHSPRLMRLGLDEKKENRYHEKNFRKEFKDFLKDFDFSGIDTTIRVLIGKPDEEIINYCKKAGTLYVGKSNKSILTRAFKGSVSEDVIRMVQCSIVAVKSEEVFKLRIPSKLSSVEQHYLRGKELFKLGFLKEATEQLRAGLQINNLHLPSILELSSVFEKLGNQEQSSYYKEMADTIRTKMMNRKIESDIRRQLRTSG